MKNTICIDEYDLETAPITTPGWIGRTLDFSHIIPTLAEVLAIPGMRLIEWDGVTTRPILDASNRIIALLGGRPADQPGKQTGLSFSGALSMASATLRRVMDALPFHSHRRGPCKERTMGVSYGGGQTEPSILRQRPEEVPFLQETLSCPGLARIAQWADFLFRTYQPDIYRVCMDSLRTLVTTIPHLDDPFTGGIPGGFWAGRTLNRGSRANHAHQGVTWPHTDQGNLAWAWCAVTALGDFDPVFGGHLILWDLGLVIRFPPGATILLPSALLTHSNVAVREGEERDSVVHFTAGGLFRYVNNGCKTDKVFMEEDYKRMSGEEQQRWHAERRTRWENALALMKKWQPDLEDA
ncbi:hypothetical protein BDZ89DRAFT_965011 [Hymenopellis radicata]|nr:hypothetical protein BDZ89DRAFT_965011 [Hymenopellis radicata]